MCYSFGLVAQLSFPDEFDEAEAASLIPDHPNVWADGSLVLDHMVLSPQGVWCIAPCCSAVHKIAFMCFWIRGYSLKREP